MSLIGQAMAFGSSLFEKEIDPTPEPIRVQIVCVPIDDNGMTSPHKRVLVSRNSRCSRP